MGKQESLKTITNIQGWDKLRQYFEYLALSVSKKQEDCFKKVVDEEKITLDDKPIRLRQLAFYYPFFTNKYGCHERVQDNRRNNLDEISDDLSRLSNHVSRLAKKEEPVADPFLRVLSSSLNPDIKNQFARIYTLLLGAGSMLGSGGTTDSRSHTTTGNTRSLSVLDKRLFVLYAMAGFVGLAIVSIGLLACTGVAFPALLSAIKLGSIIVGMLAGGVMVAASTVKITKLVSPLFSKQTGDDQAKKLRVMD